MREEEERRKEMGYRSELQLDLMDIKFRYLVLLSTRNLPMVSDNNFNG